MEEESSRASGRSLEASTAGSPKPSSRLSVTPVTADALSKSSSSEPKPECEMTERDYAANDETDPCITPSAAADAAHVIEEEKFGVRAAQQGCEVPVKSQPLAVDQSAAAANTGVAASGGQAATAAAAAVGLRAVRSQPNMTTRLVSTPKNTEVDDNEDTANSLDRIPTNQAVGSDSQAGSLDSQQGNLVDSHRQVNALTPVPSRSASVSLHSSSSRLGSQGIGSSLAANRQRSPAGSEAHCRQSSPLGVDDQGRAKILQKYRIALPSSRTSSASSLNQGGSHLINLFKDDGLEEIREGDDDDEEDAQKLVEQEAEKPVSEDELLEEDVFVPPDGGYGWLVALGAFNALFWCSGFMKSSGVLFGEILDEFPNASVSLASWIPAAMTSCALGTAPIASALCQRFNCRAVTFLGAFICALGIGISSAAPTMEVMFCTFGILTGIGIGLSTTPGVILTARYFDSNRAKANAFCLSGTAAGSVVLPFLMELLLSEFGFRGALLILGGCMLHIAVSAALFRPLSVHIEIEKRSRKKGGDDSDAAPALLSQQDGDVPAEDEEKSKQQVSEVYINGNPGTAQDHSQELLSRLNSLKEHPKRMAFARQASVTSERTNSPDGEPSNGATVTASLPGTVVLQRPLSVANSLPPHLNELRHCNFASTDGSLTGSNEIRDLQWSEEDLDQPLKELQFHYEDDPEHQNFSDSSLMKDAQSSKPQTPVQQGKALSLKELYLHQLGSSVNLCKSYLVGSARSSSRDLQITSKNASQISLFGSKPQLPGEQQSTKRGSKKSRSTRATGVSKWARRSSLMFSIEDLSTDSTSILKDSRYPSVTTFRCDKEHPTTATPKTRHYVLDRSVSCRTDTPQGYKRRVVAIRRNSEAPFGGVRRTRCYSEGGGHAARPVVLRKQASSTASPSQQQEALSTPSRFTMVPTPFRDSGCVVTAVSSEEPQRRPLLAADSEEGKSSTLTPVKEPETVSEKESAEKEKKPSILTKYFDFGLVHNPLFLSVTASVMSMAIGSPHTLFFIPSFARTVEVDAAAVLSISSIFDLIGRMVSGIVLDMKLVPSYLYFSIAMLFSGLAVILLPLSRGYVSLAVAASCYSVGAGTWYLMVPLLLADYFGVERIGSSYGLIRFFNAGANLVGPLVAGALWDHSGQISSAFFFMGSFMCLGAVFGLTQPIALRKMQKQLHQENPEISSS